MSNLGYPLDLLGVRRLAFESGAAQGRRGSLPAALGLWQAPTVNDPYQHEPALIAQEKAQRQAGEQAKIARQQQLEDAQRAFGQNVALEQLRQSGRGELQEDRLQQQRTHFTEREGRMRDQHATDLAAKDTVAAAKVAEAERKAREQQDKFWNSPAGKLYRDSKVADLAANVPFLRSFGGGFLMKTPKELAVEKKEREAADKAAKAEERAMRAETRADKYLAMTQGRDVRAQATQAAAPEKERLGRVLRVLNELKKQSGDFTSPLYGLSDEELEPLAIEHLERAEEIARRSAATPATVSRPFNPDLGTR